MESGGSEAGDGGVVQDAAKNERMAGQGGGRGVGNIWRTRERRQVRQVGDGANGYHDGRVVQRRWVVRRVDRALAQFFFLKGPKAFFNCFQYWNTGNTLFELTYSNTDLRCARGVSTHRYIRINSR